MTAAIPLVESSGNHSPVDSRENVKVLEEPPWLGSLVVCVILFAATEMRAFRLTFESLQFERLKPLGGRHVTFAYNPSKEKAMLGLERGKRVAHAHEFRDHCQHCVRGHSPSDRRGEGASARNCF